MREQSRWAEIGLGVVMPILVILVILGADAAEGPKTAYVGVLAVVPMLAAVFASPLSTALVAVVTWLSAFTFGHLASDGNVGAQTVRLLIIALVGLAAVGAAYLRQRRQRALISALNEAADAERRRRVAETDQLTGLPNRHSLTRRLADLEAERPVTVAVVDCDGLKAVNDNLGHIAGDEYLVAVAGRLAGSLSRRDVIARWGGDEFLVIQRLALPDATAALTRTLAAINATPLSVAGQMIEATVSIGVAEWPDTMEFDAALAAADRALYEAKANGRNRVMTSI